MACSTSAVRLAKVKKAMSGGQLLVFLESSRLLTSSRLVNSLYMLESYRVMLLQRPPNLYPTFATLEHAITPEGASAQSSTCSSVTDATILLRTLLTPHMDCDESLKPLDSMFSLTYLTVLSWHTRGQSTSDPASDSLWKRSLVELALHRWQIKTGSTTVELAPWKQLLFHLAFVNMHVDFTLIHSLVRAYAHSFKHSGSAHTALRSWRQSSSCEVALWHAAELVALAKDQTIFTRQSMTDGAALHPVNTRLTESPHVCVGIYMATVVLWAGEVIQNTPNRGYARSTLETGIHILSCLNVRMSLVLRNVLRHLAVVNMIDHESNG